MAPRFLVVSNGPAYTHWGRTRRLKVARHFNGLASLFGLPVAEAVSLLHIAVTQRATQAGLDTVLNALFPETTPGLREEITARQREFSNKLAAPGAFELTALVRAYFKEHCGVPLHPISEVSGLTERRLEVLLPSRHSGERIRRAEWSAQFPGTDDSVIWAALRNARRDVFRLAHNQAPIAANASKVVTAPGARRLTDTRRAGEATMSRTAT